MTKTLVTTAEQELRGLLDWLGNDPIVHERVGDEISRRLDAISRGHDGWRSRCLIAEKKNAECLAELAAVREELRDLKYGASA